MIGGAFVTGLEALFLGNLQLMLDPGPRPSHGSPLCGTAGEGRVRQLQLSPAAPQIPGNASH